MTDSQQEVLNSLQNYINNAVWDNKQSSNITQVVDTSEPTPECFDLGYYIYQYQIPDIIEQVQMISGVKARGLFDAKGNSLADLAAITDSDYDVVYLFLKNGAGEIFKLLSRYSKNITGAFLFDEGIDITNYSTTSNYHVNDTVRYNGIIYTCIKDNLIISPATTNVLPTDTTYWQYDSNLIDTKKTITFIIEANLNFDVNILDVIESVIQACLVHYVLREWYNTISNDKEFARYAQSYDNHFSELRSNLMIRKIPIVRKSNPI